MAKPLILPKPYIRRRSLLTGAAAMAAFNALPARAANAAGWDSGAKDSDLSIVSGFLGINSGAQNSTTSSFGGIRSAWSANTGKYMFVGHIATYPAAGQNQGLGICNSSASMTNAEVGNTGTNSYGVLSTFSYYNSGSLAGTPGWVPGTYFAVAVNLDASPQKLYYRTINPGSDSGWVNASWSAADPTNSAQGTSIAFSGAFYAFGSIHVPGGGGTYRMWLNMGGWPILTDYLSVPSGYSMPDANYPYTIPAGIVTLDQQTGTGSNRTQGNMRFAADNSLPGTNAMAYASTQFPASSKTIVAAYADLIETGTGVLRFVATGNGVIADALSWNLGTGSVRGTSVSTATWPICYSGSTALMAVNKATNRVWGSVDGGATWYGAGSLTTGDPAAGTNGVDISSLPSVSTIAPGIYITAQLRNAATFNAGKLADANVTVPPGYQWLEDAVTPASGGAYHIFGQNSPARRALSALLAA